MSKLPEVYGWNPKIACRTIEETAFILFKSRMVSLNEVGTFVWEYFREPSSLKDAVAAVSEEFETTPKEATNDVDAFVAQLVERQLLVECTAVAST